jgi:hypothetical protein
MRPPGGMPGTYSEQITKGKRDMSKSNANNPKMLPLRIGTLAATTTLPVLSVPKNFIVRSATYLDGTGLVADNTNFLQLSLQYTAGTVVATLDTRAAHNGANTVNVGQAMSLDAGVVTGLVTNGAAGEIPAGDLIVVVTKNGTGVPTNGVITLYGYFK